MKSIPKALYTRSFPLTWICTCPGLYGTWYLDHVKTLQIVAETFVIGGDQVLFCEERLFTDTQFIEIQVRCRTVLSPCPQSPEMHIEVEQVGHECIPAKILLESDNVSKNTPNSPKCKYYTPNRKVLKNRRKCTK